jgi:hypothetical protein
VSILGPDASLGKELDRAGLAAFAAHNEVARFYSDIIRARGIKAVTPKPLLDQAVSRC